MVYIRISIYGIAVEKWFFIVLILFDVIKHEHHYDFADEITIVSVDTLRTDELKRAQNSLCNNGSGYNIIKKVFTSFFSHQIELRSFIYLLLLSMGLRSYIFLFLNFCYGVEKLRIEALFL